MTQIQLQPSQPSDRSPASTAQRSQHSQPAQRSPAQPSQPASPAVTQRSPPTNPPGDPQSPRRPTSADPPAEHIRTGAGPQTRRPADRRTPAAPSPARQAPPSPSFHETVGCTSSSLRLVLLLSGLLASPRLSKAINGEDCGAKIEASQLQQSCEYGPMQYTLVRLVCPTCCHIDKIPYLFIGEVYVFMDEDIAVRGARRARRAPRGA